MEVSTFFHNQHDMQADLILITAFQKKTKTKVGFTSVLDISHWDSSFQESFKQIKSSKNLKGERGESLIFHLSDGRAVFVWGLGEKSTLDLEGLRKNFANIVKILKNSVYQSVSVDLDHFNTLKDSEGTTQALVESLYLTLYSFDKYSAEKSKNQMKKITFFSSQKNQKNKIEAAMSKGKIISSGTNKGRDFSNEPPNILHSVQFAKEIEEDVKANLPSSRVKVKILNKSQIQKEKMNLLLAVNRGSAYEPRVVHLTYTPKKVTSKTQHIALVGKGLTFDSGGYSLKPGSSMVGMKFDMAGAATVYAAFRNAVQLAPKSIISCFLGITDNMISSDAVTPDAIIKSRSGLNVEILNTDAEGRLVLADVLDYAADFHPHLIIDVATLTGAVVRALGTVCGVMGNKKTLIDKFLKNSDAQGENAWYLPIFEEYREDMKSKIGDLKNIGQNGNAGAQKAAVFLEKFIRPNISWIHLDIAGIAWDVAQVPYCPAVGASGVMVRSLTQFLVDY